MVNSFFKFLLQSNCLLIGFREKLGVRLVICCKAGHGCMDCFYITHDQSEAIARKECGGGREMCPPIHEKLFL